jgi:tellurite resistance protein TehA-like permease
VSRRRRYEPPPSEERPARKRDALLAFPIGVVAVALLWIGDLHLTHRDWATGAVVFGLGLLFTFLAVRQLRRAGLVR